MRIVSLLPSATEIVYALGLEDDLVGVTHECDWPPEALDKRQVSSSALPPAATAAEIDRLVSASIGDGEPIYRLDTDAIRELRPDLVISQDLCAVCAVPSGYVNEALDVLGCNADVVSLDPSSLDEVLDCILTVAAVTGTEQRANSFVRRLHDRLDAVRGKVTGLDRPRTFALEWSDPPFNGGHWVPDMIDAAGGEPVLCETGSPSRRLAWDQIESAAPEIVVFMPCGYDLEAASGEGAELVSRLKDSGSFPDMEAFFCVDATSYFSRPGPRLVDGVEILASAIHPGSVPEPPPGRIQRLV
jgi:iron complex transport system substrate-binding protein